jgi:hypothetical protein
MIDIADLFRTLGVSRYDAALPEGQIGWRDDRGEVVASARCEVILSHSSIDRSVVYGAEHAQLRAASVPVVPLDGVAADRRPSGPMDDADVRRVALDLASHRDAAFIYRCKFGSNSLYLAGFDLELFPARDAGTSAARLNALGRYVGFMLRAVGEALDQERGEPARLAVLQLDRVLLQHGEQLGADDADRVRSLLRRIAESPGAADAPDLMAESRRWPEAASAAVASDIVALPARFERR